MISKNNAKSQWREVEFEQEWSELVEFRIIGIIWGSFKRNRK